MACVLPVLPWIEWFSFCMMHALAANTRGTHGQEVSNVCPSGRKQNLGMFRKRTNAELRMVVLSTAAGHAVAADELLGLANCLLVHGLEVGHAQLDVRDQGVAAVPGEVLAHNNAQHFQTVGVGRHGVGRNDPAARAQLMGQGEFVKHALLVFVVGGSCRVRQAEGNKRQAFAGLLGHDHKAKLLEGVREVVSSARKVGHDSTVAVLAQADELVVLADNLRRAFTEVEGERRLVGAQVVDVEDQLLRQEVGGPPHDPTDTRVDKTVL